MYCMTPWYNNYYTIAVQLIVQMLPCVLYDTWYNTIAVQLHCTDAPLCTVRHLVQYNSCAITLYSVVQHVEGNLPSSTVLSNSSQTMSKLNFFSSLQEQQKKIFVAMQLQLHICCTACPYLVLKTALC